MSEPLRVITKTESWNQASQRLTIDMLERWLSMAKAGEIVSVALVGEGPDGFNHYDFTRPAHRLTMIGVLSHMQFLLERDIETAR